MPDGSALLLYCGAVLALLVVPGPSVLYIVTRSVDQGRRAGLVVNVLNPKTALFFLAFLPQFVDPGRGSMALQTTVLGAVFLALGVAAATTGSRH